MRYLQRLLAQLAQSIVTKAASFPFPFLAALLQALTLAMATSTPGVGVVLDGDIEDTMEIKAAATGSLPARRPRFARVKTGTSTLGRTPSVYISVISSFPLDSACSPRGPVSRGTPLVDEGPALTSPVFDLVLVIGIVLALSVTDILTVQETSFSWCSSCSALVFQGPSSAIRKGVWFARTCACSLHLLYKKPSWFSQSQNEVSRKILQS